MLFSDWLLKQAWWTLSGLKAAFHVLFLTNFKQFFPQESQTSYLDSKYQEIPTQFCEKRNSSINTTWRLEVCKSSAIDLLNLLEYLAGFISFPVLPLKILVSTCSTPWFVCVVMPGACRPAAMVISLLLIRMLPFDVLWNLCGAYPPILLTKSFNTN